MEHQEIVCEGEYWICLLQDRIQWHTSVNKEVNYWVPQKVMKF